MYLASCGFYSLQRGVGFTSLFEHILSNDLISFVGIIKSLFTHPISLHSVLSTHQQHVPFDWWAVFHKYNI